MSEAIRAQEDDSLPRLRQDGRSDTLCLEIKGETDMKTLRVPAVTDSLYDVLRFVDDFLEGLDCPMKAQMQVDLCVEEIFVNIAHYAYPDREGAAEIRLSAGDGAVTLTFLDEGKPYDPLRKPDPDITLTAQDRPIGGLGVFLVKKNMDSVEYRHENGMNVLTLTKKIG